MSAPLKLAIVDDTAMEASHLHDLLANELNGRGETGFTISRYDSAEALLADMAEGESPSLVFLDIILPGQDGLSLARQLAAGGGKAPLVALLSASEEFAADAEAAGALGYLLKPVRRAALAPLLDSALALLRPGGSVPLLRLNTAQGALLFTEAELLWLHWGPAGLQAGLAGGPLRLKGGLAALDALAAPLLAGGAFARPARTWLVNLARVRQLLPSALLMADGAKIPIARARRAALTEAYMDHLHRTGTAAKP